MLEADEPLGKAMGKRRIKDQQEYSKYVQLWKKLLVRIGDIVALACIYTAVTAGNNSGSLQQTFTALS